MSATLEPKIQVFLADGVIAKGKAVKIGTDRNHVAVCSATTDKAIGIAQSASTAAEDQIEVALPGGGAKFLAQATISAGMLLVPHTDGSIKKIAAANDCLVGQAHEDAVAGDLFAGIVLVGQAVTTQS